MPQPGFLGNAATWSADVTLLLEVGMGMGLLAGALLARAKRYRAHAVCQSMIVLLNVGLIAMAMIPSFQHLVIPRLPQKIAKPYYALPTVHAALGSIAELGGLLVHFAVGGNEVAAGKIPHQALQILDAQCSPPLVACSLVGNSHLCPLVRAPVVRGGPGECWLLLEHFEKSASHCV